MKPWQAVAVVALALLPLSCASRAVPRPSGRYTMRVRANPKGAVRLRLFVTIDGKSAFVHRVPPSPDPTCHDWSPPYDITDALVKGENLVHFKGEHGKALVDVVVYRDGVLVEKFQIGDQTELGFGVDSPGVIWAISAH